MVANIIWLKHCLSRAHFSQKRLITSKYTRLFINAGHGAGFVLNVLICSLLYYVIHSEKVSLAAIRPFYWIKISQCL